MRGASRVDMDGGLDAQALRFEGNIGRTTVGVHGILKRFAGSDRIGVYTEEPFSGKFSGVKPPARMIQRPAPPG